MSRFHLPRLGLHRLSLRWRLTLIGTVVLSIGLGLGGLLLLAALVVTSQRSVDAEAIRTASDVADLITAGQLSPPVLVAGQQLVQVLDAQDRVLAGSPGTDRLTPLLDHANLAKALSGERFDVDGGPRAGLNGSIRVLARQVGPPDHRRTVIVATPLNDDHGTIRALRTALLTLFLPLVLSLAAIAWWMIGRTLRPVEALRAGAEEITSQSSGAATRLPIPAGSDEIHRLAVTLNDMLDRLAAGRRRQRQFVADAAHELRNPLAGMRTHLEVARRHPDRADWQELTDDLLTDTQLLATLADDLLLLAGADEDGTARPSRSSPVELGEALAKVTTRYRQARVPVDLDHTANADTALDHAANRSGELIARADPDDLHRVLTNLLDNAVRHAAGRVRLGAGSDSGGRQVLITITDDGPGIPQAQRELVFGRFTRLDDARTGDGGAGLGLAIVEELLRRHGGTITLSDAEPPPGLRVEVRLPAA